jgi:hypothetical protein
MFCSVLPDGTRLNALFISGVPISFLKTQAIFAYATHFDSTPTALEWVNDTSVVLVYPSNRLAKRSFRFLRKSIAEEEDQDGYLTAKPIPVDLWPLETRIRTESEPTPDSTADNADEVATTGIKGRLQLRLAHMDDVKQTGSRDQSKFYKKYGERAGKEMYAAPENNKRGRWTSDDLDAELNQLRADPSKVDWQHDRYDGPGPDSRRGSGRRRREGGRGVRRSKKTAEELDAELDAFLKEGE